MAQPKVNDFFLARKRRDTHPAKRRKVEFQPNSLLPQSEDKQAKSPPCLTFSSNIQSNPGANKPAPSGATKTRACHNVQSKTSRSRSQKPKQFSDVSKTDASGFAFKSQKKITDLLEFKFPTKTDTSSNHKPTHLIEGKCVPDALTAGESNKSEVHPDLPVEFALITEEITSIKDDHCSSRNSSTPRKRCIYNESNEETSKTRKCKVPQRRITESPPSPSKSAKTEVDPSSDSSTLTTRILPESLSRKIVNNESCNVVERIVNNESCNVVEKGQDGQAEKTFLIRLVSEVESPDLPVSPLAMTPERSSDSEGSTPESKDSAPSPEPCSPKLKNLSQKLKGLSKMSGKALKNRLKQNGKLEDVKHKLNKLDKVLSKAEKTKVAKEEVVTEITAEKESKKDEETLPAYQRFEHLAKKGVPTLTLPFSYKLLEGTFQAMDSVVSMLHNRSEMCTYSKLKAAVQNYTKKNFEEKAVGQIKTVAPDAYIFRQEKNVCTQENKKGYVLTIEADLTKEESNRPEEKVCRTPEGKLIFSASALIHRKQYFHNSLLGLVMKHHKAFLASLNPPMNIPENKITRWHPKFQLDKVPDIVPSPLPQPPEVRVYHSAKDVLNAQRGRLNPRVEEALAKVAEENKNNASASSVPTLSSSTSALRVSSSPSTTNSPSMKGIPPALLAKIRAKEALKMEAALTRDPAEDNKTKMMGHLPEMIRILRSYFITEKKPALPLESIYKKLEDSYRSGISRKDVEQHVKLLAELVPELVSVVEIKRGAFLKLDRNVDSQAVANRIINMVKSRQ
ncbi:hypothetical protein EGW08_022343 [Elysia chlorotica]|uniref:CDT1 Geminin-binding domain-containing protein n=1 Tax=Elysia chlorotica TaxID=188477 RepID=A0A3S0ZL21_ELYCH|nr:hypothetical protein EGW08_022343 [Elysia chlorotica]